MALTLRRHPDGWMFHGYLMRLDLADICARYRQTVRLGLTIKGSCSRTEIITALLEDAIPPAFED